VIACEVVEHFTNPRKEFSNLLKFLNKNGLLITSTNIRSRKADRITSYLFIYRHTSYYSGDSLLLLAHVFRVFIDFRTPIGKNLKSLMKGYIYDKKQINTLTDR
jgi:hypothetical protein